MIVTTLYIFIFDLSVLCAITLFVQVNMRVVQLLLLTVSSMTNPTRSIQTNRDCTNPARYGVCGEQR